MRGARTGTVVIPPQMDSGSKSRPKRPTEQKSGKPVLLCGCRRGCNSQSCNLELHWILARLKSAILTLIISHLLILQDGEGNGTVNRRDKQGLQIRVRIRETVGIAALVDDLGIDIPLAVPERLFRRKLRAIVRAFCGKVSPHSYRCRDFGTASSCRRQTRPSEDRG